MALILEGNYSKKVGLPNFSSHQFMLTVRQEIGSADDIPGTASRLYTLLQGAVDRELQSVGWLPANANSAVNNNTGNGTPASKPIPFPTAPARAEPAPAWACTVKQAALIGKISSEHNLPLTHIDGLSRQRFGKGVNELNKLEASGLIDELLEHYGNKNGRRTGTRSTPARYPQPVPVGNGGGR